MRKHTKIYCEYHGIGEQDITLCEVCGKIAKDIHHIKGRGKRMDVIENLIGLCRDCHDKAGAMKKPLNKQDLIIKLKQ